MLVKLGLNLVLPSLVLMFAGPRLGWPPGVVLGVALLGPLGWGIYEFVAKRKLDPLAALGLVSVLATGGIGLLQLDAGWVAVKEAAIPTVLGLVMLGSAATPYPAVRTFLFEAEVLDVAKINAAVESRGSQGQLLATLRTGTVLLSLSFFLSAVLNYVLAVYIVKSPSGTEAFNNELGQMTAWSFPVITVPSLGASVGVMAWLLAGLRRATGLNLDELTNERR
jgi:hypothetical protein